MYITRVKRQPRFFSFNVGSDELQMHIDDDFCRWWLNQFAAWFCRWWLNQFAACALQSAATNFEEVIINKSKQKNLPLIIPSVYGILGKFSKYTENISNSHLKIKETSLKQEANYLGMCPGWWNPLSPSPGSVSNPITRSVSVLKNMWY